jgi:flagellar hook-length control protein FliK
MLQQVATAKSEVAAFASTGGPEYLSDAGPQQDFAKLLQDQRQSAQGSNKAPVAEPHSGPKPASAAHSTEEAKEQQTSSQTKDKEVETSVASSHVLKSEKPQFKEKPSTEAEQATSQTLSSQTPLDLHSEDNSADLEDLTHQGAEQRPIHTDTGLLLNPIASSIHANLLVDKPDIAQDWVSLVENLQKLQDQIGASQEPTDGDAAASLLDLIKPKQGLDTDTTPQFLRANHEPDALASEGLSTLLPSTQEGLEQVAGTALLEQVAETASLDDMVLTKIIDDLATDAKNITPGIKVSADQQPFADAITKAVQQAISELTTEPEAGHTEPVKTATQLVLKVIEQPAIVQDLLGKFTQVKADEQLDITNKANALDTAIISSPSAVSLNDSAALDPQTLPDLALQINKALLEAVVGEIKPKENTANNMALATLPEDSLNKVLANIAERLFARTSGAESSVNEQGGVKPSNVSAANLVVANEAVIKEFVSVLKTGVEEFKAQLAQGREPGIDLKALVTDSLIKVTDTPLTAKAMENTEQLVKNVALLLDFGQNLNKTVTQEHHQLYGTAVREVSQLQGEQTKQLQLNQFESKFEKAIAINKPEGQVQLAEKVRWMMNSKNLVAEIRLDPAELGSMNVKIAMSGESATVNFVVQSAHARDAVDNATPRLREMLAEKGIELGQSSVRQENGGQQQDDDPSQSGEQGLASQDDSSGGEDDTQLLSQHKIVNGALGGIDYFV